jgi:hypothetical protein
MKTYATLTGFFGLVAALPASRPQVEQLSGATFQPGGPMFPTGSASGLPSFTRSFPVPAGSGFAFPSGSFGHPHHHHHHHVSSGSHEEHNVC